MKTGIQVGGITGKNGATIVSALRAALNETIKRGQNDVAKVIATELAKLGETHNVAISGCTLTTK